MGNGFRQVPTSVEQKHVVCLDWGSGAGADYAGVALFLVSLGPRVSPRVHECTSPRVHESTAKRKLSNETTTHEQQMDENGGHYPVCHFRPSASLNSQTSCRTGGETRARTTIFVHPKPSEHTGGSQELLLHTQGHPIHPQPHPFQRALRHSVAPSGIFGEGAKETILVVVQPEHGRAVELNRMDVLRSVGVADFLRSGGGLAAPQSRAQPGPFSLDGDWNLSVKPGLDGLKENKNRRDAGHDNGSQEGEGKLELGRPPQPQPPGSIMAIHSGHLTPNKHALPVEFHPLLLPLPDATVVSCLSYTAHTHPLATDHQYPISSKASY
ncbi:hypothetical protein B0J13DRAFT_518457 [Dactylonectria estremocensis]|uniref:Uncharacterized protein n=1 Tax=Dactylonectria estremocensis TaxID=1079267 RepID=A0A9P9FJ63_9HYPO|nr:hypothetical protein B0J13DRAFT_518457 [Dactylonectria estremocensis]